MAFQTEPIFHDTLETATPVTTVRFDIQADSNDDAGYINIVANLVYLPDKKQQAVVICKGVANTPLHWVAGYVLLTTGRYVHCVATDLGRSLLDIAEELSRDSVKERPDLRADQRILDVFAKLRADGTKSRIRKSCLSALGSCAEAVLLPKAR